MLEEPVTCDVTVLFNKSSQEVFASSSSIVVADWLLQGLENAENRKSMGSHTAFCIIWIDFSICATAEDGDCFHFSTEKFC